MSLLPLASPQTGARQTRSAAEIHAVIAAHVQMLIGEDDAEFTDELVTSFRESVAALCDQAEAAAAVGDAEAVSGAAHQIKGSASNVGLNEIADEWHAVEEAASNRDSELARRVEASVAAARRVVRALNG